MSRDEMEALFGKVMSLPPAERLKLAAGILESGRPEFRRIAVDVAKSAVEDVERPLVMERLRSLEERVEQGGTLGGHDILQRTGKARIRDAMRKPRG